MPPTLLKPDIDRGLDLIKQAAALDNAGNYANAFDKYKEGAILVTTGLKAETSEVRKNNLTGYIAKTMKRMDDLKKIISKDAPKPKDGTPQAHNPGAGAPRPAPAPAQAQAPAGAVKKEAKPAHAAGSKDDSDKAKKKVEKQKNSDNDALNAAISHAIVRMKPDVKWDDVVGLQSAKEALKEAVILPFKFPQLFQGKREPWRGILLYGCPGTGKSFIAKAVAAECDATFFSVSSSDLVSKYVGESARLIKSLFEMARAEKQAVIFIDEIDSLVSARGGSEESDASRQIKTEFLVQMQGVGKSGGNVLILGATNYPESLDSAIRRRFEKRIEITLPDAVARANIIRNGIGTTPNSLVDEDYMELGRQTENYSGSDLSILCKDALMEPVRILQKASYFRLNALTGMYEVSSSDVPGAEKRSFMDIPSEKLGELYVTLGNVLQAKARVKPSVSASDKERIAKFTTEFGST